MIEECVFTGNAISGAVAIRGDNLVVRNCVFGPINRCADPVIRVESHSRSVLSGNVFLDIGLAAHDCIYVYLLNGQPVLISGNHFIHLRGLETSAGCIWVSRNQQIPMEITAIIDQNVFEQCQSAPFESGGKALNPQAPILASANRFVALEPLNMPAIEVSSFEFAESQLRYNLFESGDYAVRSETHPVDALLNYWGDSNGPHNARYNPGGRGARVDDLVQFDPWLPDTSFLSAIKPQAPFPTKFLLEAFPNPFNHSVTLRVIPSEVRIVRVDLFDILGRKVQQLWRGPLAEEMRLSFDASGLASGTYFVRVTDLIDRHLLTSTKLVMANSRCADGIAPV